MSETRAKSRPKAKPAPEPGDKPTSSSPRRPSANGKAKAVSKVEAGGGFFITLEGGEGSGKSTQMKQIAEWLRDEGREVVATREPGGSPGAEAVRHVLLSGAAETFGAEMEAILFAAARGDHVDTVIAPALAEGKVVISDRFFDSTRVYQGVSGKASPELVGKLERVACGDTWPDLTLIIDVKPEEGMKRAGKRRSASEDPDRFEKESLELQQQRRDAYLEIARAEPERCVVVSGAGTPETVFARLKKVIAKRLADKAGNTSSTSSPVMNVSVKSADRTRRSIRKANSAGGNSAQVR